MLKQLGWLSINQLACEVRLMEVWKALYQEDYCLKEMFERVPAKQINTRSTNKVRLQASFRSRIRENSFQFPSVQLWNAAPSEVTEADSESKARAAIRNHVKQTIPI